MTADPAATPEELAHYGGIAQHLSEPRRQILEVVDRCGPVDLDRLNDCWRLTYPAETARLGPRLGHLATGLLWKLEALGWIDAHDRSYASTPAGQRALDTRGPSAAL